MRQRYRQRKTEYGWVLEPIDAPRELPPSPGPYIMPDIAPYRSIITQEMITSRSQHRVHLRAHNCEEIGDQAPAWLRERQREQKETENG